ncbi:reverse transcriptase domain-containing protein [Tanacetum coccineum]
METEDISERYDAPCFVNGLEVYDREINLEHDKNLISNEFAVKFYLEHEVKNGDKVVKKELIVALTGEIYFVKFIINPEEDDIEPIVVLGRSFLRLTKGLADFENEIITIYPDPEFSNDDDSDKANDSKDDWDVILEGIDFGEIPEIDGLELPPYVCNMRKSSKNKKKPRKSYKMKYDDEGPSPTVNRALTREEISREELEKDLWERIVILNEPRPIIETLKYGDRYKKVLDIILLDKLKLDGELELEEEEANEEMIREYKAIKEKEDPGVFVLPIRLEGRFDTHALADTGSNINIIPYRIFEELGREYVKPVSHNVSMLNHCKAEPMEMLKDVLCQVGIIMVLAKFLILGMPVDRTVPIIIGRSFLHTCGGIINTLKGTTSTFDGVCHQKFYVSEIQNNDEESDSDDDKEYYLKRDKMGRPFYGPNLISYFDRNDPMERALAI